MRQWLDDNDNQDYHIVENLLSDNNDGDNHVQKDVDWMMIIISYDNFIENLMSDNDDDDNHVQKDVG
jgi:hypothetical protein